MHTFFIWAGLMLRSFFLLELERDLERIPILQGNKPTECGFDPRCRQIKYPVGRLFRRSAGLLLLEW